jgi:hypothetical protein
VLLSFPKAEARFQAITPADLWWVLPDLTPISRAEARAGGAFWLTELEHERRARWQGADGQVVGPFYYRCRHFDETTRECRDYDGRPPICRRFPGRLQPNTALPPPCEFRRDLGQPVEALVTFLGRRPALQPVGTTGEGEPQQ